MSPVLPPRRAGGGRASCRALASPLQILLQMGFSKHRACTSVTKYLSHGSTEIPLRFAFVPQSIGVFTIGQTITLHNDLATKKFYFMETIAVTLNKLKALAATGNRSVQLASDWLLTHVNDTSLDTESPREYILYACPTGALLTQLHQFWEKSKAICTWNGAHNYPPHITLVSFFKAPDDCSLQLAKALKHAVESVGFPPDTFPRLEPYVSHNFMGLFVCEEHADYFKRIALQYVKQVSSAMGLSVDTSDRLDALATCFPWCAVPQDRPIRSISLEPHVKSLHITLAYQFPLEQFAELKREAELMQPLAGSGWELRLYSRDSRLHSHLVHKVIQEYVPRESDELELVLGDYVYIDEAELGSSADGWVQGASWLTGVSGLLPAVYTVRTAESDAWTLHRVMSLAGAQSSDSKSESDSATECEGAPRARDYSAAEIGLEKSEEAFREWRLRYQMFTDDRAEDVLGGKPADGTKGSKENGTNGTSTETECDRTKEASTPPECGRRWLLAMRHGERVDMTYGSWIPFCFEEESYVRKDLNMPLSLPVRAGGKWSFEKDSPLTRLGQLQAYLVGEGLREAGVQLGHVYSSPALRCVETAHHMLRGLQSKSPLKIKVDPGLFEHTAWHPKGVGPFMTTSEHHNAGYEVDLDYKPYYEFGDNFVETVDEYYARGEKVTHGAYRDTEAEGGNVMFVGHASTLDTMWQTLRRYGSDAEHPPYALNRHLIRVPYCSLAAMRDRPLELVPPPCPPCINTSCGRFDWKIVLDV